MLFRRKRRILRIRGLLLAVAKATAGHNWLTRPQQGWSGASLVSFPYLASKIAHGGTQGLSLVFTAFSWCVSFAEDLQTVVPGGNLPLRK